MNSFQGSSLRSASPNSRKRARADDGLEDREVAKELQSLLWARPVRDDVYYFSDGSCILRVEDTLFNVCRDFMAFPLSDFNPICSGPSDDAVQGRIDVRHHVRPAYTHCGQR